MTTFVIMGLSADDGATHFLCAANSAEEATALTTEWGAKLQDDGDNPEGEKRYDFVWASPVQHFVSNL